jgi:hypothetical protein
MRGLVGLAIVCLAVLAVGAGAVRAEPETPFDPTYDCGFLESDGTCAADALGSAAAAGPAVAAATAAAVPGSTVPVLDPDCRLRAEAVFWTGSDWLRLTGALAADRSPCAEYWLSIPPLAANKKGLRVLQDDLVRALGIHPVAEMTLGDRTGWANWVKDNNKTWYEAGVEFRKAMARAGYDVTAGETWLLNEFDRSTARDAERTQPDHPVPAYRRADMRELLRGLYEGAPGMPASAGIAEIGIHFRHQNIPDLATYKADMQGWLLDDAFWSDADRYLRWLAVENYPDTRLWGVPGSSRDERRRHLEDYLFHLLELVRSGPPTVAQRVFEEKFLPLENGGWRARGGDQFEFVTGHGNTIVDDVTMRQFVSEQVYATRHYAGTHPHGAPAGRIGFSWQPCNRLSATEADCRAADAMFVASLDAITARIAESIHYAYRQGGASPAGACAPPGAESWCAGERADAVFTERWHDFGWE